MSTRIAPPSRRARVAAALLVAAIATAFLVANHLRAPEGHSDFGAVWFGAKALLQHQNPYALVGPGLEFDWDFRLNYPATTLVAAIPFTILSEMVASALFVFLSAGLFAYGLARGNWNRIWILPSAAFIVATRNAQWSPLIGAAFLLPSLGFALNCKPSLGLAVIGAVSTKRALSSFFFGGVTLWAISLILYPGWVQEWAGIVSSSWEFSSPVMRLGGPAILFAALRWRRAEARLLLLLSLVPQTSSWYEALLPMLVGESKREVQALSLISSAGYIAQIGLLSTSNEIASSDIGIAMVAFCYLPAVIVVLRRPNVGELPAWLAPLRRNLQQEAEK